MEEVLMCLNYLSYSPWASGGHRAPPLWLSAMGTILFVRASRVRKKNVSIKKLIPIMFFKTIYRSMSKSHIFEKIAFSWGMPNFDMFNGLYLTQIEIILDEIL